MNAYHSPRRSGISLMEVLISIGVIALGIFGVASLIPVAQFKVAEGTSNDRQAAFGPSVAAQFRVQQMGSPQTWFAPIPSAVTQNGNLLRRGYCIDPLGLAENLYAANLNLFPANATTTDPFYMVRLSLKSVTHGIDGLPNTADDPVPQAQIALARNMFFLKDELTFDIPDDQSQQPRRQYFVRETLPVSSLPAASMSWFATLSPTVILSPLNASPVFSDEFLLSLVVVKDRLPTAAATEENYAAATCRFAGEVALASSQNPSEVQMNLADLRVGDWILLSKPIAANYADDPTKRLYRWTQIIGTSDEEDNTANALRNFTISNDDFLRPGEPNGVAIFMRGVAAVYERTIRIDNTSSWN